eukprot:scaffold489426_cov31-Prasinocladus_malaysianus.AAC.1
MQACYLEYPSSTTTSNGFACSEFAYSLVRLHIGIVVEECTACGSFRAPTYVGSAPTERPTMAKPQ